MAPTTVEIKARTPVTHPVRGTGVTTRDSYRDRGQTWVDVQWPGQRYACREKVTAVTVVR